ncbi:hypothetical protein N665_3999s0005 [Sinapis alba]|nr:hypothetical protein N665_3999s0005 [Sinapis alba]
MISCDEDSEAQMDLESVPAIQILSDLVLEVTVAKMESTDSMAETDTNELMAKKGSKDFNIEIDSNQDTESLEVDSRDSISEIDSNKEVEADPVDQLAEFEKEVSIYSLEPSLQVKERQSMLLQNSNSQFLVNESGYVGVWFAPKVDKAFILDVEIVEELIQMSVETAGFVAHYLFDQLLLRIVSKMKQLKYQKNWNFKYKLKHFLKIEISRERSFFKFVVVDREIATGKVVGQRFYNIQRSVGVTTNMLFDPGGVVECTTVSKELEQQVVDTSVDKPWGSWGTALAICLRVLWPHLEQWYWPRPQNEDSYTIEMERYMESDYVTGSREAAMLTISLLKSMASEKDVQLLEMLSSMAQVQVVLWFLTYQNESVSGYIVELLNEERSFLRNMWRASLVFSLRRSVSASMEFPGSVSVGENARYHFEVEEKGVQLNEKLEEKQCLSLLWKRLLCKDWRFKFKNRLATRTSLSFSGFDFGD